MKNIVLKVGLLLLLCVKKNKNMKSIFFIIFLLLEFVFIQDAYSQADELYYSPYSYYGLGDRVYNNSLRNRALGSIGLANSSPININMENPASYADLKQTTFEFSGSYKWSKFITDSLSINRSNVSFDGLNFGFPANKKFTLVMGLNPYSKSGYKVKQISDLITEEDTLKILTIRSGDGGINRATLGLGLPFLKHKLNLGINGHYYFGNISRYKETAFLQEGFINTLVRNRYNYNGFGFQLGVLYSDSVGKSMLRVGATYQSSINLKYQLTKEYFDVILYSYTVQYSPYDTLESSKSYYKNPAVLGLGIGMDNFNKFAWGIDFEYYDASQVAINEPNTAFKKSYKIKAGFEWVPNFSEEGYWKKVAYRMGGFYHQSELYLFEKNIHQMGFTLGMGLPFRRTLSRLNLFFEVGQRGIINQNLVKELYFSTGIGVTFNETWFIKRKLD